MLRWRSSGTITQALALCCCITNLFSTSYAFQYPSTFPKSKLYQLPPDSLGIDNLAGTIAAFGDFNGDKYTDLIVLGTDQASVSVYTWNHVNSTFMALPNAPQIHNTDFVIENIIPGDFTFDGKLDLLIMGRKNPSHPNDEILMRIYKGNGNDTIESEYISLPSAKTAQPMVADITGDMKSDILGYAWDDKSSQPTLSIWTNIADPANPNSTTLFNVSSAQTLFDTADSENCVWSSPHSNAFLDLDGDCLADLVFTCTGSNGQQSVQFWVNNREQGFKMVQQANLPNGAGPLSFADIDGDGSIDIMFPVCSGTKCQIHIVYNQQMPLCAKPEDSHQNSTTCRQARNLCVADPDFKFDFDSSHTQSYSMFDMNSVLSSGEYIRTDDTGFQGSWPVPIRLGDYNLDGYPDLLVVTNKRVVLFESVLCDNHLCPAPATNAYRRAFKIVTSGTDAIDSDISNPRQAAFFDIAEDGTLDILVLQLEGSSSSLGRTAQFVLNNYFNDAFFLKGLVSNGVCPGYCPNEPRFPSPKPYGVNYPGATFKFTVLDTSGVKRVHQVPQLSQTGYLSLQTPYSLFGLGRTNNYIEEMFAGTTRHQAQNYLFYEGVIPNSQLIFIPYQPDGVEDSSTWKVELYIQPADYIPWVFVTLAGAAAILATVVATLNWMEKREDRLERRKALHIVNFDAL
ncbi:unnamed protein product [Umbelopsis ramanniana]